jgi:hypothetical protein
LLVFACAAKDNSLLKSPTLKEREILRRRFESALLAKNAGKAEITVKLFIWTLISFFF